jgi:GAF domain-containing protein
MLRSDKPASELPAAELAELNDLLWSLPSTLDPYAPVAVLLEKGARLFQAPLSCAFLREGNHYELAGVYGFTDKKAEQLWGRLDLANREPVPLHLTGAELHALSSFGKRRLGALLAMPLSAGSAQLGWVIVARFEPSPFTEIEQEFMAVILDRVGASIDAARRFQDAESRSHELALLYELAELLVSTIRLDELLERVMRRMVESFDLTFSALRLHDPTDGLLNLVAYHHRDPDIQAAWVKGPIVRPLRVGEGIAGTIIRRRTPYVARDIMADPLVDAGDRELMGPGSLIVVPLMARERVLGILYWNRAGRQRPLNESLVPLVSRVGNLVSVAIVNAQLYQDLEVQVAERTADLKAAHQALEARMATGKEVVTQATLKLRSRLQDILGYGDLLHHLLADNASARHLQQDYLEKVLQSAEEVNGLVEGLLDQVRRGELG